MDSEIPIYLYAAVAIAVVLAFTHPRRAVVYSAIAGRLKSTGRASRRMLPQPQAFVWRRFWIGSLGGALAVVFFNLLPYFLTRHEPGHDGVQVMGFPFTFWSFGGYSPVETFHGMNLLLDLPFGLLFTGATGWLVAAYWQSFRSAIDRKSLLLLVIAALSLAVHFEMYRQTSASAFINQPVFYYNRFYIREHNNKSRDVSLQTGFWSYLTAALSVGAASWGLARILIKRKTDAANHFESHA